MIKRTAAQLLGPLNDIEQKYAPRFLYAAGDLEVLNSGPRVSVIGSRRATDAKREQARLLCEELVQYGAVVVSGLAEGIDTVAHTSAMGAGGRTIAVLGTPLDRYYPRKNRGLQETIMSEHLAVSQFPPGTSPQRGNFPQRNRTMALISHASIIVEAAEKSGTRHQGWEALRLGRPLFFLSDLVEKGGLEWPQEMMRYGATSLKFDDLWPVLDELPLGSGYAALDEAV